MSRSIRRYIRSNHLGLIALFVALGGVSYAAVNLPAGSVGTKQLKKNAVVSSKVKNRSLRKADFAVGQLPAGVQGPTGLSGPQGATGVTARVAPPVRQALTALRTRLRRSSRSYSRSTGPGRGSTQTRSTGEVRSAPRTPSSFRGSASTTRLAPRTRGPMRPPSAETSTECSLRSTSCERSGWSQESILARTSAAPTGRTTSARMTMAST